MQDKRRSPEWWDDYEVDQDTLRDVYRGNLTEMLIAQGPHLLEHDYALYTDGSGCIGGWGGYAAIATRIQQDPETRTRYASQREVVLGATYGSTVQRCEFTALLEGVWKILSVEAERMRDNADRELKAEIGMKGALHQFRGDRRKTIIWYTDRKNLAEAFLYDENGEPLQRRKKERDLWQRWSAMAQHVCITPRYYGRNVIKGQEVCDFFAGEARAALMGSKEALSEEMHEYCQQNYPMEKWTKKKTQKAQF